MIIEIDSSKDEALYLQLRNQIIMGIAMKQLSDGEVLPSVRQLASDLGVNMHTVNKAYALLKDDGYVQLDRKNGTVISVDASNSAEQLQRVQAELEMIVAQAICKKVSLEDMQSVLTDVYKSYLKENQAEIEE